MWVLFQEVPKMHHLWIYDCPKPKSFELLWEMSLACSYLELLFSIKQNTRKVLWIYRVAFAESENNCRKYSVQVLFCLYSHTHTHTTKDRERERVNIITSSHVQTVDKCYKYNIFIVKGTSQRICTGFLMSFSKWIFDVS